MERPASAVDAALDGTGAGLAGQAGDLDLVRQAFDQTSVGLTLISLEKGECLVFNRAFCELSGYEKEEFVGGSRRLLAHAEDAAAD